MSPRRGRVVRSNGLGHVGCPAAEAFVHRPVNEVAYGNFAATHWMPDRLEPCETVWQARVWRDEGSWNQTVLVVPLAATPMGMKLGVARIWERAAGAKSAAVAIAATAPKATRAMV